MGSIKLLKMYEVGRIRRPRAKREKFLDEFEVSVVEYAEVAATKYPTLADWVQRRRRELGGRGHRKRPSGEVRFLEAVLEGADAGSDPQDVELPGGACLRITEAIQGPLAVHLRRCLASR